MEYLQGSTTERLYFVKSWFKQWWGVIAAGFVTAGVLLVSFDVAWWPVDEGVFAYVADQIRVGKVYGVDVVDFHGGYLHFLNAWSMSLFGRDTVVLLYPIVFLSIVQSVLFAYLVRQYGQLVSFAVGMSSTFFGLLYCANPSPNLYALFIASLSVLILTKWHTSWPRELTLGFIIGICFLIRHPSAIFLVFGLIAYFIYEANNVGKEKIKRQWVSIGLLVSIGFALVVYLTQVFEPLIFIVIGVWPFLIIGTLIHKKYGNDILILKQAALGISGAFLAILPMLIYQIKYGNLSLWFSNSFVSGSKIIDFEVFSESSYLLSMYDLMPSLFDSQNFAVALLSILFWVIAFIIPVYVGLMVVKNIRAHIPVPPIVFVSVFFGYVSIYYQHAIYYYFSFPLFLLALVFLVKPLRLKKQKILSLTLLFMGLHVWLFQSYTEPLNILNPHIPSTIQGVSLKVKAKQNEVYNRLVDVVNIYTSVDDPIYAFPMNPGIYFVTERENIFPFFAGVFYISNEEEYNNLVEGLAEKQVKLFIFDEAAPYKSVYDYKLLNYLVESPEFELVEKVDSFSVFTRL